MDYSRKKQCDDSQGGSYELYVFPFIKYSRSQVTVKDNILISFPYNDVYKIEANNISFEEDCKEDEDVYYDQKLAFTFNKILQSDSYKDFASKDFRAIIKDNNNNYRLIGLYTGLKGGFSKSTGANKSDSNGFNVIFDTKEESTAPFLNGMFLFEKNLVFTVDTSLSALDTFTIPTTIDESYMYNISTSDGYTAAGITGNHTITFPTGAGIHEVTINGVFPRMYFNNTGDKLKITKVNSWGDVSYSSNQNNAFYGCSNLTSLGSDIEWINTVTTCQSSFRNNNLTTLPTSMTLDGLVSGSATFDGNSLTSLPVGMSLGNLADAFSMFKGNNLTSLPDSMELSMLTFGLGMFRDNMLTTLPSLMTLGALTVASDMFKDNDISALPNSITLSSLTNGNFMFSGNVLTDLPNAIKLSALTSGTEMFLNNTINTTRYSQLLIDMENLNTNNNVPFNGGNSKYNASGKVARDILTGGVRLWTITDGGLE